MRQASFLVSHGLLRQLLHLPDDTEIRAIEQNYTDRERGQFRVFISHPDLAKVMEGCHVPSINLEYEIDDEGNANPQLWGQE